MKEERGIDEIKQHRHHVLPDAESFRVVLIQFTQDFETRRSRLRLRVRNEQTGESVSLCFTNPTFDTSPFLYLQDATGLYIMKTSYLGWDPGQAVEVGDWDDGLPLFWAETVCREEGDPNNTSEPISNRADTV
jgi:hypothetical protein